MLLVDWMPTSVITIVSVLFVSLPIAAVLLMRTRYPEFWIIGLTNNFSRVFQEELFLFGIKNLKQASLSWAKILLKVMRAFIESGLSLLCIYATVPMFFLGMNIKFDWLQVMGRMVLLNLVLYFFTNSRRFRCRRGGLRCIIF